MASRTSSSELPARGDPFRFAAKFAEADIEVLTIDLVRDPRDVLASRGSFQAGGTMHWARDAETLAAELMSRLDELDRDPPDLRLRYEDLACDLDDTAHLLAERLGVDLNPSAVDRPAQHVTTSSAKASVGRWRDDVTDADATQLAPVAARLGY